MQYSQQKDLNDIHLPLCICNCVFFKLVGNYLMFSHSLISHYMHIFLLNKGFWTLTLLYSTLL